MIRFSRRHLLATLVALPVARHFSPAAAQIQTGQLPGKIAFVRQGSIWQWSGGDAKKILDADNISDPRWNPDGSRLIYSRAGNSFSDLYVYDVVSKSETQLTNNQAPYDIGSIEYAAESSWAIDPDWSASGLIGFISDAAASGGSLSLFLLSSLEDQPYLALQPGNEEDIFGTALSADGSLAAYTVRYRIGNGSSGTYIALRDLNTGEAFVLIESQRDQFDPAISPDSAWVAFAVRDQRDVTDLWIVSRATGERARLTKGANASAPRFSSDGKYLVWLQMADYQFELWVANFADGQIANNAKIYDEDGIDPQSGLSWWVDPSPTIGIES